MKWRVLLVRHYVVQEAVATWSVLVDGFLELSSNRSQELCQPVIDNGDFIGVGD